MSDDDMNTGFQDPFERLNNLEANALESSFTIMGMSERIMEHSQLGVKISTHLIEIVRYIDQLNQRVNRLELQLKQMDNK
jgi:uncharacterized coiled-coil protein SlyX